MQLGGRAASTNAALGSVLIVDDHPIFADSIKRLVEAENPSTKVTSVGTMQAALESVEVDVPDIVLMDYTLPDGDGLQAARLIIAAHPHVAVLMLTGSMGPDSVLESIRAGCAGYIPKTGGAETVRAALRAVQGGSVYFEARSFAAAVQQARRSLDSDQAPDRLSQREHEVLTLLAQAMPASEIAERLFLSPHTVRTHIQNVIEKLGAHSKLEAVAIAARRGLVSLG